MKGLKSCSIGQVNMEDFEYGRVSMEGCEHGV